MTPAPISSAPRTRIVPTPTLAVACEERGPEDGEPVVLLHGFPYDPRCFDQVAPRLAAEGYRVIAPYLRGYGATRFRDPGTMRSGQQAALARDLLDLLDALALPRAALMGFDWGGRAACIVAALWPERVRCLVTGAGYNVQDIARTRLPLPPEEEHRLWYQYYLHSERGRAGLAADRRAFCRYLWRLWSPTWTEGPALFDATAPSFDNPDFVDVVVHSYRHRFGLVPGDPALDVIERRSSLSRRSGCRRSRCTAPRRHQARHRRRQGRREVHRPLRASRPRRRRPQRAGRGAGRGRAGAARPAAPRIGTKRDSSDDDRSELARERTAADADPCCRPSS